MSEEKRSSKHKTLIIILAILLAIIIALGMSFLIMFQKGKMQFHKDDKNIYAPDVDGFSIDENIVTYNGKDYLLNENVVSVLFMGIDKENINDNFGYGVNGQADSLFVAAVDTKTKKINLIPIPRESMVDVNTFDSEGGYVGTNREQICLAFAYGDDAEKSCENVKTSVSRLLMGINISSYVALDLKGVEDTTTKIGGITLNAIESVPYKGKLCSVGDKLLLKGKDARAYIQSRTENLDGSTKRLLRQKQFLSAFASTAGNQILNDFTKLKVYYDGITPFINTDLSFSQISYLVSSCITKDLGSMLNYLEIKGTMALNGKWAEFTPNSDSLITAILSAFYTQC